jgi:hypothetical protein
MAQPVFSTRVLSPGGLLATVVAASSLCASAAGDQPLAWRDTQVSRLEVLAVMQTLNAELLASASATLTLEQWCRDHSMAEPALVVARQVSGADLPPSAAQREDLQVSADEPVRYRRVELRCGDHLMSVAENWYVPARLSVEMNQLLETTQQPFGKVVLPLHPSRHTLAMRLQWHSPDGTQPKPDGAGRTL